MCNITLHSQYHLYGARQKAKLIESFKNYDKFIIQRRYLDDQKIFKNRDLYKYLHFKSPNLIHFQQDSWTCTTNGNWHLKWSKKKNGIIFVSLQEEKRYKVINDFLYLCHIRHQRYDIFKYLIIYPIK